MRTFRQVVLRDNEKIEFVNTSFNRDWSIIWIHYVDSKEDDIDTFEYSFIEDAAHDHEILMDIMCK